MVDKNRMAYVILIALLLFSVDVWEEDTASILNLTSLNSDISGKREKMKLKNVLRAET
ncbi:MAG TPA: hypothetical protein VIO11_01705 [Candidatus Methanoperedens sp.]